MALNKLSDEEYLKFILQDADVARCIGMFEVKPLDDPKNYFLSEGRAYLCLREAVKGPDHDARFGSHYFFGPRPTNATTMFITDANLKFILNTDIPQTVIEDIGGFQIISFVGIKYDFETDTDI